jgi:3-isopropylmalate/(R)-2-methylmalate dehydratase small subunit
MEPFTSIEATAVPMAQSHVDTDQILPARFLHKPRRDGFGQYLFHDLRFGADGAENAGFLLNHPPHRGARILVAAQNFGCGSSRENAVWALYDYGFRVVIAPSFGDIFRSNSLKNGLLPVVLPPDVIDGLLESLAAIPGSSLHVDLALQTVTAPDGARHAFDVDPFAKHCLLNGVDELDYTLSRMDEILAFERANLGSEGT